MAQIEEWGPHIWKILHTCAEHAGTSVIQMDEIRAWIQLLRLTEGALPCAMCRTHYKAWRASHPLEYFLTYRGEMFKEKLRYWLWELHESVNKSRGVEEFSIERLGETYRQIDKHELNQSVSTLVKIFEKSIAYRQVNPSYVADWRHALVFLRKLISF